MIWAFVGPEGSGKTLGMTYFSLIHKRDGGNIKTFPGYKIKYPHGNPISTDIDFRSLFSDLYSYKNTLIDADEIQNFADSYNHMSVFSRLVSYVCAQRRKANFGLIYTVQDWGWVHPRIRTLTHLITFCKDVHWSHWGKENHIPKGEMISMVTYDLKGIYTGEPWTLMSRKTLHAKEIWPWYDTYAAVDIFEGMKKYEIKKETEVFDLRPQKEEPLYPSHVNPEEEATSSFELLQGLASQGVNPMMLSKISKKLK